MYDHFMDETWSQLEWKRRPSSLGGTDYDNNLISLTHT